LLPGKERAITPLMRQLASLPDLKKLNSDLIENLETGTDLFVVRRLHSSSDSLTCACGRKLPTMINEVAKMLDRATPTTQTALSEDAVHAISEALKLLLSDTFALYLKTKNFHWHMSGPHFRDYHLLLDDQSDQIFSMTDAIAERARKIGGTTIRSIGQISRLQRIADNEAEYVKPLDMIAELRDDNAVLTQNMRELHSLCDEAGDVATASLLENWIDDSEKRTWFLFECGRCA
jgi:starvation-inducible DNA-binding protein